MLERYNLGQITTALRDDRQRLELHKDSFYLHVENVFSVHKGSALGRRLEDYQTLFASNSAINFIEYAQSLQDNATIVDVGCGAASALLDIRKILPDARLVGIDHRDTRRNTLITQDGTIGNVGALTKEANVELYHDTYANIRKILPDGYDILLAVGAFNGDLPEAFQMYSLAKFYKGLRLKGIAQLLIDEKRWQNMSEILTSAGMPHSFHLIDKAVLEKHSFDPHIGTLTLGPKL